MLSEAALSDWNNDEEVPKYDFSDVQGKLEWKGDAVKAQRKLRDEW